MAGPQLLVQRTSGQAQGRKLNSLFIETSGRYVTVYQPGEGVHAVIKKIHVVNRRATKERYILAHVDNGASVSNADIFQSLVTVDRNTVIDGDIYLNNLDTLYMYQYTSSCFIVNVFGEEVQIRAR